MLFSCSKPYFEAAVPVGVDVYSAAVGTRGKESATDGGQMVAAIVYLHTGDAAYHIALAVGDDYRGIDKRRVAIYKYPVAAQFQFFCAGVMAERT